METKVYLLTQHNRLTTIYIATAVQLLYVVEHYTFFTLTHYKSLLFIVIRCYRLLYTATFIHHHTAIHLTHPDN